MVDNSSKSKPSRTILLNSSPLRGTPFQRPHQGQAEEATAEERVEEEGIPRSDNQAHMDKQVQGVWEWPVVVEQDGMLLVPEVQEVLVLLWKCLIYKH